MTAADRNACPQVRLCRNATQRIADGPTAGAPSIPAIVGAARALGADSLRPLLAASRP